MKEWRIEAEPDGENDGVNNCGMVIWLVSDQGDRQEVEAVGFIRENSRNPEITYREQLGASTRKAKQALDLQRELEELSAPREGKVMG
jgi:hypothetical protein